MPWLVVGGLVVIVIWLASKSDTVKDELLLTPTTNTGFNPNLPLAGSSTISPSTAQGSYTAGRPYQQASESFQPLVLPVNPNTGAYSGVSTAGAFRGMPMNVPRIGTRVTAPTSNISQTLQVSPAPQNVQVLNAVVVGRTLPRPLTSRMKY